MARALLTETMYFVFLLGGGRGFLFLLLLYFFFRQIVGYV
jgi:hypothetical protein